MLAALLRWRQQRRLTGTYGLLLQPRERELPETPKAFRGRYVGWQNALGRGLRRSRCGVVWDPVL